MLVTDGPTSTVAHAAQSTMAHDASPTEKLGKEFHGKNCLNGYKPLFADQHERTSKCYFLYHESWSTMAALQTLQTIPYQNTNKQLNIL